MATRGRPTGVRLSSLEIRANVGIGPREAGGFGLVASLAATSTSATRSAASAAGERFVDRPVGGRETIRAT